MNQEYNLIDTYCRCIQTETISKQSSIAFYYALDHSKILSNYDFALPAQLLESVQNDLREYGRDYSLFNVNLSKYFTCYAYTINMPFGLLLPSSAVGFEILNTINYFSLESC